MSNVRPTHHVSHSAHDESLLLAGTFLESLMLFGSHIARCILLLFALHSSQALATDWVEMHDFGEAKFFLRAPTPIFTGKPIRIWSMTSFRDDQMSGNSVWRSKVTLEEYDCESENVSAKYVTFYPEAMAKGKPVYEMPQDKHSPVQPGSFGRVLFEIVCKR